MGLITIHTLNHVCKSALIAFPVGAEAKTDVTSLSCQACPSCRELGIIRMHGTITGHARHEGDVPSAVTTIRQRQAYTHNHNHTHRQRLKTRQTSDT